jgi:polysaccharide export outer membrane protein
MYGGSAIFYHDNIRTDNALYMKFRYFAALAVITAVMSACSTHQSTLTYFEDLSSTDTGEFTKGDYSIKIVPDDELFISVTSIEPTATSIYNLPQTNPATTGTLQEQSQLKQQTYRVDAEGNIMFPVIGKVHVEGLTTLQLTKDLASRISADVHDPIVHVELVNFRVNVLGEVAKPGAITINRDRYTLLDALADAGDMTPYGERTNVLLIREEGGKRVYHRLNLNDSKLLESPYFYLQQNDVVLVQANKIRQENAKYNQNNAYKLSVISTIVSACSIVASLIIALVVK